ncbi:hypothetical protein [Bizionia sp.]|uniref:hypothetical protein n=1 Tax=Bizionia sp. TaxID=1954480 RepID=UPI003A91C4AE
MIKKLLSVVLLMMFFYNAFGQNYPCAENFSITTKTLNVSNSNIPESLIYWDFSKSSNNTSLVLELEIQTLNNCWDGLNGTNRSEIIIHKINNLKEASSGELVLTIEDLNAKCYKWRTKIVNISTNCESFTNWEFFSFL